MELKTMNAHYGNIVTLQMPSVVFMFDIVVQSCLPYGEDSIRLKSFCFLVHIHGIFQQNLGQ